jgi:hypothetical protein
MHSIICSSPAKTLPEYEGWKHVPQNLKTRRQWLRVGRRVRGGALPAARVVYPRIIEGRGFFGPDTIILDQTDDFAVTTDKPSLLFDIGETAPYNPTPRTLAYMAFEDIFFKYARKDCWIRKTDLKTGDELEDWTTENEFQYPIAYHQRNLLTEHLVRKHINQRQIIGVKGGELTMFVVIDLDFHGRSLRVFEAQAEILLNRFHGVGSWHYQVKKEDVTGLQMIYVFEEPRELAVVHKELRAILVELDAQHPELASQAKAAGMKTLAELEIYPAQRRSSEDGELATPDNGNGVRLPLCRERVMLLDKPLALVPYRKQQVQDVEGYIQWLKDPARQYMPKERVLDYLHYFAWETGTPLQKKPEKPAGGQDGDIDQSRWYRNMRRWLFEFWIEGNANDRPLNEHIAVLCRLAAVQGYSEPEIRKGINALVLALPACAKACSSRLLKGKYRKIDSLIRCTAKYACQNNGHQRDAKASNEILAAVLMRWPDFDSLDTSTWAAPAKKVTVTPNWSDQQRRRLCAFFRRPLFVKDDDLIIRFLNGIVNLTLAKEKQGDGWGKEYLLKWMKSQFPEIKCAKDEKRQRIIKCLEEEGIIQVNYRGRAGMYCTHWTLGNVARLALGISGEEPEHRTIPSPPEQPQPLLNTSTYYGSLFSDEDLLESGCKEWASVLTASG